jgi:hypothetical protein
LNTRRLIAPPTLVALLSVLTLAGCSGNPTTPAPSGSITTTQPPGTAITPGTPVVPVNTASQTSGDGRILLLDVQPGKPAAFTTQPGRDLTIVASAATYSPTAPSFRLSVDGAAGATASSAYKTQSAPSASTVEMPFRAAFSASTAGLLPESRVPARQLRHVAQAQAPRALGSTDKFWVNTGDSRSAGDLQQTAVLKRVSANAYF